MSSSIRNSALAASFLPLLWSGASYGIGEITALTTELQTAENTSYRLDNNLYEWGLGQNLILKSFIYEGETIAYNKSKADTAIVRRVANNSASGAPCSVYTATMGISYKYQASYPGKADQAGSCDYGAIVNSEILNVGSLDIFSNSTRKFSIKNIERVDLIFSNGLTPASQATSKSGHVIIEKSGNNHVKIAAITALDANGDPKTYGTLVTVYPSFSDPLNIRYGITNTRDSFAQLANENKAPQGYLREHNTLDEHLGAAFVTVSDLGIKEGQEYFGISVFPADVDADKHTLTDPKTFPTDTGIDWDKLDGNNPDLEPAALAGDADIIVGTAGEFTVGIPEAKEGEEKPTTAVEGNTVTKDVVETVVETGLTGSGAGGGGVGLWFLAFALVTRSLRGKFKLT